MRSISLDPGEATGWATWDDGVLVDSGTDRLWEVVDAIVSGVLIDHHYDQTELFVAVPSHLAEAFEGWREIICEDWAIYPWEAESHGLDWDTCRTARGIGAVELICRIAGRQLHLQPASIKDGAEAAGAEQLFSRPLKENRHANDAIRHGVYFFARQSPEFEPTTVPPPTEGNDPA